MKIPEALSPFRSRNYRLFFAGRTFALPGMWISQTAIGWLVYDLTQSTLMSGAAMFLSQVSHLFVTPAAGVMFDRTDRFRMLVAVQFAMLAASLALALYAVFNGENLAVLFTLCFVRGLVGAVEIPTRQSLVSTFVGRREDLPQAIGLNATQFNFMRVVAPAAAGEIYARAASLFPALARNVANLGAAACFFADVLLNVPSILLVFALKFDGRPPAGTRRESPLRAFAEGVRYAASVPVLRAVLVGIGLLSTFGFSYTVLLPMFAHGVYGGSAGLYGQMLTLTGAGAIVAALTVSVLKRERLLPRFLVVGNLLVGASLVGMIFAPPLPCFLALLFAAGFGSVLVGASSNTLIQLNVDAAHCGRVVSLYTMMFTGTFPFGTLLLGFLDERFGTGASLGLGAGVCFAIAATLFAKRRIFADGKSA